MRLRVAGVAAAVILMASAASLDGRQAGAPLAPTLLPASVSGTVVNLPWTANPAGPAATLFQIHAGSAPGLSDIAIITVPANPTLLTAVAPPRDILRAHLRGELVGPECCLE
jgi:hypothetical protein